MTEQDIAKKPEVAKPVVKKRTPHYKQRGYDYSQHKLDMKEFHYYWGLDVGNNLKQLEDGGYTQVMENGKPVTRRGKNEEAFSYLLKIPMALYLQDQEGKLQEPREIEEAMRGGTPKGSIIGLGAEYTYGGVQTTDQVGRSMINKTTGEITKIPV